MPVVIKGEMSRPMLPNKGSALSRANQRMPTPVFTGVSFLVCMARYLRDNELTEIPQGMFGALADLTSL